MPGNKVSEDLGHFLDEMVEEEPIFSISPSPAFTLPLPQLALFLGRLCLNMPLVWIIFIKHLLCDIHNTKDCGNLRNVCETWSAVLTYSLKAVRKPKGIEQTKTNDEHSPGLLGLRAS